MEMRPFRGWRYRDGADGDVSDFIAPPYDVLSADDKQALLKRSAQNIVAVDLPHVPPKEAGPDEEYRSAAALLTSWKKSGVLQQEAEPALYVYEQSFRRRGRLVTRQSLLCGLRATPLGDVVKPHEKTFAGPKADRMKLNHATHMQLSPIFGFYRDSSGHIATHLTKAAVGAPTVRGEIHGLSERLWTITDKAIIDDIAYLLRDLPVFIADGHHRYTTGLAYRDELKARENIGADHEANFILFALVAAEDPGMVILGTHRLVRGLSKSFQVERLVKAMPEFTWQRCSVEGADLSDADAFLKPYGPGAMAFFGADPAEIWIGRLSDHKLMEKLAPDQIDAWRKLDVAVLHKIVIDRALEPWRTKDLWIDYTPDGAEALRACQTGKAHMGVIVGSTPLEAVEQIALAGATMPHKSTYFYPKMTTGIVLKPLE